MNYVMTFKGVKVPIDSLNTNDVKKITTELTVEPTLSDYQQVQIKYRVYLTSKNHIYVPRFYFQDVNMVNNTIAEGETINLDFKGKLRESTNQLEASSKIIEKLNEDGGSILSLPTGYGKTTVALHILSKMNTKTLIIVHKEFLLNQWKDKIKQFLPEARIGQIQGPKVDVYNKDIVIGMLQSLSMKDYDAEIFKGFGFTIIDETHHICSRTFSKIFSKFNTRYILGLSATLERSDGLTYVLHWFLGKVGYHTERRNQHHVDVDVIEVKCDEYEKAFPKNRQGTSNMALAITTLCDISFRNDLIMSILTKLSNENRKSLLLTDRREHCFVLKSLCDQHFNGNISGLYMGGMKSHELKESEEKQIIIGTYTLAHEGLDIPSLDSIVLGTPKSNIIQAVGRILRETDGKQHEPLIIDLVDKWGPFYYQFRKRKIYYDNTGFRIHSNKTPDNVSYVFCVEE